MANKIIDR